MNNLRTTFVGWRWLWLALVTLMLSASALAQSTIVHVQLRTSNPDPNFPWDYSGLRLMGANPQSYELDFDSDGAAEYIIRASGPFSSSGFGIYGEGTNYVWAHRPFDSSFVVALIFNDQIGPNLTSPMFSWELNLNGLGSKFSACVGTSCAGYYNGLDSGYAGLQFQLKGKTHFGWVRVGAPLAIFNGGWIYEYAYETRPNTPIRAGAKPVAVPLAAPQVVRPGQLRLIWPTEINKAYQIQFKENLSAFLWTNMNISVVGTTSNAVVDVPIVGTAKFFRVVEAD